MRKYLIEGSCDGGLFAEAIEADTMEAAEAIATERLCEAWGHTYGPDTTLDDLGDSASVTEYSADDYARDAAADMLVFVDQVARLSHTNDADNLGPIDPDDSTAALDGLILKARTLAAVARGEG